MMMYCVIVYNFSHLIVYKPGPICLNLFLENCGKNAKQALGRDNDHDGAAASNVGVGRCLPMPTLLAACAYRRLHVTLTVTLARLPVLHSSLRIFEEKRDCSQSIVWRADNTMNWRNCYPVNNCWQNKMCYIMNSDISSASTLCPFWIYCFISEAYTSILSW